MNTIETIRAEVVRLIKECDGSVSQYGFGKESACNRILNFLDTLQEQPVCEGLEEEIERYIPTSLAVKFPTTDIETIKSDIRYIARHFAQWQKEQMMENALHGWLDEDNEPPYDLNVLC